MTKVTVKVIDRATDDDITESAEITVYNQDTNRYINKRADGYWYCNAGQLYAIEVSADNNRHKYNLGCIYDEGQSEAEEIFYVEVSE